MAAGTPSCTVHTVWGGVVNGGGGQVSTIKEAQGTHKYTQIVEQSADEKKKSPSYH